MDSEVIVGIDIGDHKVCALVGEVADDGNLRIIGVGTTPSHGVKRGMVVSVEELTTCVATAIDRAQRVSGYQIHRAEVAVTGTHVSSHNSRGIVAISRANHQINHDDVARAIEAARAGAMPSNREILHVIPRFYIVDGQEGVPDPVEMYGFRLEVEAHIITASATALRNIERCLKQANIEVREMVAAPLAAAEAVLSQDEKEMGVVVADIGGGTTGICIYLDGSPLHTAVLGVGGTHVTNDLTVGLRLPYNISEDIKIRYGHALANAIAPEETIEIPIAAGDNRVVSRKRQCEIIEDRVAEMYAMIVNEIKKTGQDRLLPGGVVLTGGAAELPGMAELGREIFGLPVRVGTPQGVGGLVDSISSPAYAASVGLLQWGLEHEEEGSESEGGVLWDGSLKEAMGRVINALRRAFGAGK